MNGRVTVTDGVVRWVSSGRVPPRECLDALEADGVAFDRQKSLQADREDLLRLLAQAKALGRDDSPEAQFERLAAFGPVQEIVDVLTGHRYRT